MRTLGMGGDIQSREARGEVISPFPYVGILPDGPPILGLDYAHSEGARSHPLLEYSSHYYRFLPIFRIRSTSHSSMTTFYMTTVFFFKLVLRGNYYIRSVELFEASSILPLPECLESSE